MEMAQSEIRGNHSSTGDMGTEPANTVEAGSAGTQADPARPIPEKRQERETKIVTGHPEGPPARRRVTPAERDRMVRDARDVNFPAALRGYERVAVDRYVREVNRLIAEFEISSSPESAVRHALDEVSEETREILQRAHQTAEELTARSRAKADDRLEQAEREVGDVRDASRREVGELREAAADEARQLRELAEREVAELRDTAASETQQLRAA